MILAIRRRHRVIWVVLAVILPLLFAAAIFFRHGEPINEKVPQRIPARQNALGDESKP
jgi:hypothetical protein